MPLRTLITALLLFAGIAPAVHSAPMVDTPAIAHTRAVCADYPNQAAAQRAADTIDGDGDGIYCESLPCPCLRPGATSPPAPTPTAIPTPIPTVTPTPTASPTPAPTDTSASDCQRPTGVQPISFSKTKYPNIRRHVQRAIRKGWPRVLVLNRPGAGARRERLLAAWPTREGQDRDEYPPAVGRGRGKGLTKGNNPRGRKADVAYVPSAENRSHGSRMGIKLRSFCDGTKFKYVFY
jgi:hypothetical protein